MRTSPVKLLTALLAAVAFFGTINAITAAPPPGLRWGDTAFGNYSRTRPAVPTYFAVPSTVAAAPSVVVGSPAVAAAPVQTITIRGADGVVRTYPVVGGVVQQLPAEATTGATQPRR